MDYTLTLIVDGDTAIVSFPFHDPEADRTFHSILANRHIPVVNADDSWIINLPNATAQEFEDWEIALPTNDLRNQVLTEVHEAIDAVQSRIFDRHEAHSAQSLASLINYELSDSFETDAVTGLPIADTAAPNISVEAHKDHLVIKIPPLQKAIDELEKIGATWVARQHRQNLTSTKT